MATWIEEYKELRNAWLLARGEGAISTATGARLPRMIAGDALALLGPFSDAVLRFHRNRVQEWIVNTDSVWSGSFLPTEAIKLETYLMRGTPHPDEARKRKLLVPGPAIAGVPLPATEQYVYPRLEGALLQEAQKQMMASWQAAINTASAVLRVPPVTRKLSATEVEACWSKMYALTVALDVAGDTPAQDIWDAMKEIATMSAVNLRTGVKEAADIAGQVAGEIAQTTGEVAGRFGQGFFSSVGAIGLVVAGGAIFLAAR